MLVIIVDKVASLLILVRAFLSLNISSTNTITTFPTLVSSSSSRALASSQAMVFEMPIALSTNTIIVLATMLIKPTIEFDS